MNKNKNATKRNIDALSGLVKTLRGRNGCPWDKKQTPRSMAVYLLEETYELVEAIEDGAPENICEELGDVLFLVLFVTQLFQEKGRFGLEEVASLAYEKMIRRHPHVFGKGNVNNADEVKQQWHQIKLKEKKHVPNKSILDSVSPRLPALMRAYRVSERAARSGFDWNDMAGVIQKVEEEWSELKEELEHKPQTKNHSKCAALEFGDVLFTLVNIARFANIHPETALTGAVKKFEERFKHMEKIILETGRAIEDVSQDEKNRLWEEAKKNI